MNRSAAVALALACAFTALADSKAKNAECLTCHDEKGAPHQASAHGSMSCTDCHTDKKGYPHPATPVLVKCESCHTDPVAELNVSVHAKASAQPCQGCHGDPHGILPASNPKSSVYPSNLPRTCGGCHGDAKFAKSHGLKEVYSQYMDSIHGFAL